MKWSWKIGFHGEDVITECEKRHIIPLKKEIEEMKIRIEKLEKLLPGNVSEKK